MSVKYTIDRVIKDLRDLQKQIAADGPGEADDKLETVATDLRWFLEGREFQPGIQVWYFDDSGDAYDATQCRECIDDGDVVVCLKEGVVGVLMTAWPTAVTRENGALHTMAPGYHMNTTDDGKYCRSYDLACAIAARNNLTIA